MTLQNKAIPRLESKTDVNSRDIELEIHWSVEHQNLTYCLHWYIMVIIKSSIVKREIERVYTFKDRHIRTALILTKVYFDNEFEELEFPSEITTKKFYDNQVIPYIQYHIQSEKRNNLLNNAEIGIISQYSLSSPETSEDPLQQYTT